MAAFSHLVINCNQTVNQSINQSIEHFSMGMIDYPIMS